MSWTYSGDPATSALDQVRFLLGDTDSDSPQLSNEEIDFLLSATGNEPWTAAIRGAYGLASKYSRKITKSMDDLSISYDQLAKHYRDLAVQLRNQAAMSSSLAVPYAGGISVSDKLNDENDTDRTPPSFTRGMHDFTSSLTNETLGE